MPCEAATTAVVIDSTWLVRARDILEANAKVAEMKELLKERGLKVSGSKAALVDRLHEALEAAAEAGGESEGESEGEHEGGDAAEGEGEGEGVAALGVGQQLSGEVTNITHFGAFVSIGAGRTGLVPLSKMSNGVVVNASDVVSLGQEVDVWVSNIREDGAIELSMVRAKVKELAGSRLSLSALRMGQMISGWVTNIVDYGAFIDVGAERDGLLPKSKTQGSLRIGQKVESMWVSGLRATLETLELTMVREGDAAKAADGLGRVSMPDLRVGMRLQGVVTKTVDYGAFVGIGTERDGLLPKRAIDAAGESLQVGQEVEVWIKRFKDLSTFELSLEEVKASDAGAPPVRRVEDLRPGQRLTGRVAKLVGFGVFVDVGAGRNGLLPIAKMPDDVRDEHFKQFQVNQELDVWVSSVRPDGTFEVVTEEGKVGEEMAVEATAASAFKAGDLVRAHWHASDTWHRGSVVEDRGNGRFTVRREDGEERTATAGELRKVKADSGFEVRTQMVGEKHTGVVASIKPFGAFVDIGAVVYGLVPINRMAEGPVFGPDAVVNIGQEVDVWISKANKDGTFELSMLESKMRAQSRDVSAFKDYASDEWLDGTVAWVSMYGIFVDVQPPNGEKVQRGMVHRTDCGISVTDCNDIAKSGDQIRVRVSSVDDEAKRLTLSMMPPNGRI